jgi:hypothetical protein
MLKAETTTATGYAGGSGTTDVPYQIATFVQFRLLSETTGDWNKSFILITDIDADDTKNWNSGSGFSPIGSYTTRFTGAFNGDGYEIRNLYIDRPSTDYVGFFGCVLSATISKTGLINGSPKPVCQDYTFLLLGKHFADNSLVNNFFFR